MVLQLNLGVIVGWDVLSLRFECRIMQKVSFQRSKAWDIFLVKFVKLKRDTGRSAFVRSCWRGVMSSGHGQNPQKDSSKTKVSESTGL